MSFKIGIRRVNLTVRRFYDSEEIAQSALDDLQSREIMGSFEARSVADDGRTVRFGDDMQSADNWAIGRVDGNGKFEFSIRFIGSNKDFFMDVLSAALDVVDTFVVAEYETELRFNRAFSAFEGLPVDSDSEYDVRGVEVFEDGRSYRFTQVSDGESVVLVNVEDEPTIRPPFDEFYDEQVEEMVEFVKGFVPTTATV